VLSGEVIWDILPAQAICPKSLHLRALFEKISRKKCALLDILGRWSKIRRGKCWPAALVSQLRSEDLGGPKGREVPNSRDSERVLREKSLMRFL